MRWIVLASVSVTFSTLVAPAGCCPPNTLANGTNVEALGLPWNAAWQVRLLNTSETTRMSTSKGGSRRLIDPPQSRVYRRNSTRRSPSLSTALTGRDSCSVLRACAPPPGEEMLLGPSAFPYRAHAPPA